MMIFARATTLVAMSTTIGTLVPVGTATANGLVPKTGRAPLNGAIREGPLEAAYPISARSDARSAISPAMPKWFDRLIVARAMPTSCALSITRSMARCAFGTPRPLCPSSTSVARVSRTTSARARGFISPVRRRCA